MDSIIHFFVSIIQLAIFVAIVIAILAFMGYNKLRASSELIKEAWSNISVAGQKQASLINQLIDVVKGYQESEKLIVLKVSEDMSTAAQVKNLHQQSDAVLSNIHSFANRFPELKANQQYQRLIDSIQSCEAQLENVRARYNTFVRSYNVTRSSIPNIFFAPFLGFNVAPYLEFKGNEQVGDMASLKSFSADDDGERLNALLAKAGEKIVDLSSKTAEAGKAAAQKVVETGKAFAEKTQETRTDATVIAHCPHCNHQVSPEAAFCSNCGSKLKEARAEENSH